MDDYCSQKFEGIAMQVNNLILPSSICGTVLQNAHLFTAVAKLNGVPSTVGDDV